MLDGVVFGHGPYYRHPDNLVNRHADSNHGHPAKMSAQTLGSRLKEARKLRRMSQVALAQAAKVKQPSISELETGETKVISGDTLISVSDALRIRPEWLVTGRGPMEYPVSETLTDDELDLLHNYRGASNRWKLSLRLMAKLRADKNQDEVAEGVNMLLAKIAADPVSDDRLGERWTRPDSKRLQSR